MVHKFRANTNLDKIMFAGFPQIQTRTKSCSRDFRKFKLGQNHVCGISANTNLGEL